MNPKAKGIKRRQLYDDIDFMQSDAGWQVDLEKIKEGRLVFYRYSDPEFTINKSALNTTEAAKMSEVLNILARFRGMPQFEWMDELVAKLESNFGLKPGANKIIDFDENKDYLAVKHISPLFNSILYKTTVLVSYKSFKSTLPKEITFFPHYLKQYNNRWFCFGFSDQSKAITNLALDRIVTLKEIKRIKYKENTAIDFNEYFEDVIGVTVPENVQAEKIILKVDPSLWPYIETKPIHGTQKTIKKEKNDVVISIEVKHNYELESLLLSFGNRIQVVEPVHFRKHLHSRTKNIKV
jgi:predicted DNA-binding transcriptional regulator YafY